MNMKTTFLTILLAAFAFSIFAQDVTRDLVPRNRVIIEVATDVTG
jgi:hypothetical protein